MPAPTQKLNFEDSLRQAHAALRAGRAATAERRCARSRRSSRRSELPWLLGAALLEQEKVAESIATLGTGPRARTGICAARVDLARALPARGPAARAREEVRRVLEKTRIITSPGSPTAMRWSISGSMRTRASPSSARG